MGARCIVFLDCDGVLVLERSLLMDFDACDDTLLHDPLRRSGAVPLERRCISNLKRVLDTTGASVVLTTTWRLVEPQRAFLVEALESHGLAGAVVGDTPDLRGAGRGDEVKAWLAQHPGVENFVVLDDSEGHARSFQRVLPSGHFVQTMMRQGLTEEKADLAIQILQGPKLQQPDSGASTCHFGVIRHSVRADASGQLDWEDQGARPYDSPICDFELPRVQAQALRRYGFGRVVSSPFRRCLQTAAVLSSELGVPELDVHLGLGENMAHVRRDGWPAMGSALTYVTEKEMAAIAAQQGVRLGAVTGEMPCAEEDAASRFGRVLGSLSAEGSARGLSVLAVSHGEAVGLAVEAATGETVVEAECCAWAVFECAGAGGIPDRLVWGSGYTAVRLE